MSQGVCRGIHLNDFHVQKAIKACRRFRGPTGIPALEAVNPASARVASSISKRRAIHCSSWNSWGSIRFWALGFGSSGPSSSPRTLGKVHYYLVCVCTGETASEPSVSDWMGGWRWQRLAYLLTSWDTESGDGTAVFGVFRLAWLRDLV